MCGDGQDQEHKMTPEQIARLTRPNTYALDRLGIKLHPVQADVLKDLFPKKSEKKSSRVSFRCANEVGKTSSVATAAILYAIEILNAQVISTAGVWMQVAQQLIPNLKRFSHLYPKWQFNEAAIKVNGVDRYVGFSTRDEGFAQGFHKRDGMPLLAIIDEAAAVSDNVIDPIEDRCNPDFFLIMGSPLDPVGRFYDIETKLAKYYTHHHLNQLMCLTKDGYWIEEESVNRKIEKYGSREHPFIQSNVLGEFSKKIENALLSLGEYNACVSNPPEYKAGVNDRHAFIDVAGGGDKNVYAFRMGNKVRIVKKWVERSEMATCGEIIAISTRLRREFGLQPEEISMDASGAGKPMADRLREMGWDLYRFTGQSKIRYDQEYSNAISEVWGLGTMKIKNCDIILPDDDDFRSQVLSRALKRNSAGKFQVQPKDEYCRGGKPSPDEADAVLGAMMPCFSSKSVNLTGEAREFERDNGWVERATEGRGGECILPAEACL